ncbi:MAG: methylenetetrahydrofolate--tRNA-(uracil(54)-C(5))-methyltransferase (FADH(2)-oxidizing) TrmFO [Bdellovibrionaceae bacterium]|nr:methylenetetrahydrofolate--tRNA-(uracil(54)-C(5))-methyltransferase (FADH(2)-oxidizing) TrmFO [Pseudobdellovibrionaceae bacterium]
MTKQISVVGAGLAGSECALQLANMGYAVTLYEMRGVTPTPAHKTTDFAELVCSNSFGSQGEHSAPGQLKWEAAQLKSFILKAAQDFSVPAGQALGIDREKFAAHVTELIEAHPNIKIQRKAVNTLSDIPRPTVVATGPLTHEPLAESLKEHFGQDFLYFFDAIAPIIDADSINTEIAWKADRYDKGTPDYYNCPMNKEEYNNFIKEIELARKIEPKHFETTNFFEGCMPIEVMVERGPQTLRFGPMKPIGLDDPRTGRYPWAVVQLRQDNKEATAYNIVGFQTRMAYAEQTRIFRMIPGLENAEFLKLGSIHRNLFINTPKMLNKDLSSKSDPWLFFAGQITGVEGYFESVCTGLMVAHFLNQKIQDRLLSVPPRNSAFGSLLNAITDEFKVDHFQPTNINFSLLPPLETHIRDKTIRKAAQIKLAREALANWKL